MCADTDGGSVIVDCAITTANLDRFRPERLANILARSRFEKTSPARDSVAAKALAANVRRLRKGKGWTQDVLAAEIAVGQVAVSLIENGRANPTLLVLESLAEKLKVRVDQLFEVQSKSKGVEDR